MTTHFTVGDITIDRVVETEAVAFDPLHFFPTLTPELLAENRSWLDGAGINATTGKLELCMQSYVVRTPHHTILVDTCVGNDKTRPAHPFWNEMRGTTYMAALAAAGVGVEDIDFVMCTHLHIDHVGWNTRLENGRWVPTFPNARYAFSEKELAHWTARNEQTPLPWIIDSVLPIVAAGRTQLVTSDHVFDEYVRLEPTPGHTPDHFAVRFGRGAKADAVMAGDLIHSPLQTRYPEMSMFSDSDPATAAITRRRFLECYCETGTLICTAHFPSPSVGTVERHGDAFGFASPQS